MSNERISSTGRVMYPWEVNRDKAPAAPAAEVVEAQEDELDED